MICGPLVRESRKKEVTVESRTDDDTTHDPGSEVVSLPRPSRQTYRVGGGVGGYGCRDGGSCGGLSSSLRHP